MVCYLFCWLHLADVILILRWSRNSKTFDILYSWSGWIEQQIIPIVMPLGRLKRYSEKEPAHRVERVTQPCHGPLLSHSLYSFFFLAGLLLLITYPICDTVRLTLYEREVLAPAAGHRGASGLISSQVIRQTGGAYRQGHGGTGGGRQSRGEEEGIVGRLYTRRCGFVLPGGPLLCWTGLQRADNQGGGWMDVRITTRSSHMCPAWWTKYDYLIVFWTSFVFWRWRLVENTSVNSYVFESWQYEFSKQQQQQQQKKLHKGLGPGLRGHIYILQQKKKSTLWVRCLLLGVCGVHILLAQPGSPLVSLSIFQPFSPSACNSSGCCCSGGQARREPPL